MRLAFLGTPEFAVPALRALAAAREHELAGVVCQPDRPVGRKAVVTAPAVKRAALELGLEVAQPETLRAPEAQAWLAARRPDALIVVAFGQLLPRGVFEAPRFGAINAHASLLPHYRGAAPMQWAIANGETRSGVTTMQIDAGLDTGPTLLAREVAIGPRMTAAELGGELAQLSAALLLETLRGLAAGTLTPRPQPQLGTLAPILKRDHGRADWRLSAAALYNRWRGFQPWPGLWTTWRGQRLAILKAEPGTATEAAPGSLHPAGGEPPQVACGESALRLIEVQLEGRKAVRGEEFARFAAAAGELRLDYNG